MKSVNNEGVTLIELVVVLVIIAIMAGLLVPNIGAWLPNYRLRGATRDIVSVMRTAQMKAVSTNSRYRVNFDVAGNNYILQYQTTSGPWVNDGAAQNLPTGITFKEADFGSVSQAVFNSNSTSSAGSVTLQNTKGATKSISLTSSTGRVNIN
jgi:prepilin-type N-terminal cleavage/methylation domain-containing protein